MQAEQEEPSMRLKSEIEHDICISLGGRAAEMLYYGNEQGLSTGVSADLEHATELALGMVGVYGMDENFGLLSLRAKYFNESSFGPISLKAVEAAKKIVKQQLDRAIEILKNNRKLLDRLSEELLKKNRLTRADLEKILPPPGKLKG